MDTSKRIPREWNAYTNGDVITNQWNQIKGPCLPVKVREVIPTDIVNEDINPKPIFDYASVTKIAIDEKMDFISKNKEALIEAWVAQHGWKPDECILVQKDEGLVTKFWMERKPKEQIEAETKFWTCFWSIKDSEGNTLEERSLEFRTQAQAYAKASQICSAAKECGYVSNTEVVWRTKNDQ